MARGNNSRGGRGHPSPARGGRGGFQDGGRGRGRGDGRGRGRGGRGRGGYDHSADVIDFPVQIWNDLPPTPPNRGRGGAYTPRGNATPRGRGGFTPRTDSPRGYGTPRGRARGAGIGSPDTSRSHEAAYARRLVSKMGAGASLSRVLYDDRPFLRPITFVRSTFTATLFLEEEEILQPLNDEAGEEEETHVPTADRVAQLFSGGRMTPPLEITVSDQNNDDGEDLEEIDFEDVGRIQQEVDLAALEHKTTTPRIVTDADTLTAEVEEKFTGFYIDTKPAPVTIDFSPFARVEAAQKLGFYIDTTPAPITSDSNAPPLSAIEALGAGMPDEEEIVYIAPHPRKGRTASETTSPLVELSTTSILTGTQATRSPPPPLPSETVPDPMETLPAEADPAPSGPNASATLPISAEPTLDSVQFTLLGTGTPPSRLPPRQSKIMPKSLLKNRRVKERRVGTRSGGSVFSGFRSAALAREEAELQADRRRDPRWKERRRGDEDLDWGDESDENPTKASEDEDEDPAAAVADMLVDGIDIEAMKRFVHGMGPDGSRHVTMDDIQDAEVMKVEDEEAADETVSSGSEDEESEEDEEEGAVFMAEEEMLVGESADVIDNDLDDNLSEDDEEDSPRRGFQARLEKLRKHAAERPPKKGKKDGKGKQRAVVWSEDEDDDDFDEMFTWADEDEDVIAGIEAILDENADILEGRDRKAKKRLFDAIRNGDSNVFMQPAPRRKNKHVAPELQAQWNKDRAKKAEKKRERELAKLIEAADPLAPKKGGKKGRKATLAAAALDASVNLPNRVFDTFSLEVQIRRFLADINGPRTMALPPLAKEERAKVHELALAFNLKSQSKGKGTGRYTTLIKTTRSGIGINENKISRIVRNTEVYLQGSGKRGGRAVMPKHKEGEVVGKAAPKLNESNIGFQMLAKMGWEDGDRIGATGGLEVPLVAVIKHTKLGLGATR